MKKFILFVCVMGLLASCEPQEAIRVNHNQQSAVKYFNTIRHFEYEGHQYISFESGQGKRSTRGIVHNPDCYCK